MAEMTLAAVARGLTPRADQPGVFSGYASLFGTVDSQGDLVEKGAFRPSLEAWRAKGRRPAMLWQHDHAEPIGLWTGIEEDATGLRVEGRLLLSVRSGAEAYEHIKAGTVNGNTYTEAMFAGNGYADALPKLLRDVASHAAQLYQSPSAPSILVADTGDVTLTVAPNKTFARGQPIRIARTSDPASVWMTGTCLDYVGSTGALVVRRSDALGSGTFSDWTVSVDGGAGPEGPAGPIGATPAIATTTAATLPIQLGPTASFACAADLPLLPGAFLLLTSGADPAKWMAGQIATKSGATLTVDVQAINGAGSPAGWTVQLVGPRGIQGPTGPAGGLSLAQVQAAATSF